ncbi:MAG: DUF393 domain-containing protein [bacterium]|nr:DUF393 domain-containing protein [bacterium]
MLAPTQKHTGQRPSAAEGKSHLDGEKPFEIEVFYDGDCPLCLREIQMLKWLDRRRGRIQFTDIASPDFQAERYGKTFDELMAEIHGRTPDGEWLIGVEVFRRLYSAVGFSWMVAPTRLPAIKQLLDVGYRSFAKYRLPLTGRRCDADCKVER